MHDCFVYLLPCANNSNDNYNVIGYDYNTADNYNNTIDNYNRFVQTLLSFSSS